ncbi:hypothetical protein [Bradyrhizobium sp. LHD-71]|uniref:hypothetical protein n=1 Tax=Bradyrhizobium sp. LHD-71 TaxID=3072141 RepID=UPI002810165D|nr:hypothetical protein [Bradyrhizobium sp. LHD-71]MDQ8732571.1 hypothetical protein [Bradyrhizobium sp. LHD-71]
MNNRARMRLALGIAAAAALTALTAMPLHACDSTRGCPSSTTSLDGVAANALPTYPQPTEEKATQEKAAEPIALKKFTKTQSRTARRAQSRKASASQRTRVSKDAANKEGQTAQDETASSERAKVEKADKKVTPTVADAHAKLLDAAAATTAVNSEAAQTAAPQPPAEAPKPSVELVSADEFNDLDRTAWEANQMPKLMQLSIADSQAELQDDSKWAQTSMIGKLFVAFGALLTVGSAIRMFMT